MQAGPPGVGGGGYRGLDIQAGHPPDYVLWNSSVSGHSWKYICEFLDGLMLVVVFNPNGNCLGE